MKKSKKPKAVAPIQETFEQQSPQSPQPPQQQLATTMQPHAAVQSDMNHACRNYGVCPPGYTPPGVIEGFEQQSSCQLSAPFPPIGQENAESLQKQMSEVNKFLGSKHMYVGAAPLEYDDELQSYLQEAQQVASNASKSAPASPSSLKEPVPEPQLAKTTVTPPAPEPVAPVPAVAPAPVAAATDRYRKWMELALFALAGVLLVFLLEQIFRMGVMVGMKHTAAFLEPFVEYAQNLKE